MKNRSFKENYKALKSSQKRGKSTPFYTRFINRNIGRVFAAFLAQWNISPNTITCVSGIFTFGGFLGFLLIPEIDIYTAILLVLSLVIGFGLDSADGLVSRLLSKQSMVGEWLDHTFDAIKIPLGHGVAVLLILNEFTISRYEQAIYLIILSSASALFLANILKGKIREVEAINTQIKQKKQPQKEVGDGGKHIMKSILTLPLDYGVFMALFLLTPLMNSFHYIYLAYGIFFTIFTFISLIKSAKEISKSEKF